MLRRRFLGAAVALAACGLAPLARAGLYEDLFEAISRDDAKTVRALMLKGVGTNSPDRKLGPAIVYAGRSHAYNAMGVLLESPLTDVTASDNLGQTALHFAALHGELAMAKKLVARGAQVNQQGWTPLHYAVSGGKVEIVKWLVEEGAYIDAESPNGTTPLMLAARQGRKDIAKLLVEEGADPSPRNEAGLSVADYFERTGEPELAEWMRQKAREFTAKYGTKAKPVAAPSN